MNLAALQISDPEGLVNRLAPRLKQSRSVESACQLLSREMLETCVSAGGERSLVLSRVYLSMLFSQLDPGAMDFARSKSAGEPRPVDLFLALVGTWGDEPDWQDRRRSRGHRAIPLNRDTVKSVPMLARCFQQIGFDLEIVLLGEEGIHLEGVPAGFGLFHVEEARGSPYIPAQEDFVVPRGVRSAIGCGAMLPNGAVSIWIGFSRHPIPRGAAVPLISLMPAFWVLAQPLYRRRALFDD